MPNAVNTVVVGYGYAGQRIHVPLIRLAPQLRLHGVCSSDPGKRARIQAELGCRAYETLQSVLNDEDVALVVLATPNMLHAPQAIAAMSAGKHVVVDKPMCLTSSDAAAMIVQATSHRRILSIFHNRRFDGDYLTLREHMTTGALGEVRWLEMAWQRFGLPRTWKQKASEGGGRLVDLGSHMIDQILQVFPAPVASVYARFHHDWKEADAESHAMVTLCFQDGRTAVVDTGSVSQCPKPRILAIGDKATYMKHGTDPQEAALAAGCIDTAEEDSSAWGVWADGKRTLPVETVKGRWRDYYENLGEVLLHDDPYAARDRLLVTPEQAARVVAVLEAAGISAARNEVQRL